MDSTSEIPEQHRALQLTSTQEPLALVSRPTPPAESGSAVIRILAASVLSYSGDIYNGKRHYPYPTPFVPGASAAGRVAAVGSDATSLSPGQLVLCDPFIPSRDDPDAVFLSGIFEGHTDGSRKLARDAWRDSTYAEYVRFPLEVCIKLDEARLLGSPSNGGLGYTVEELLQISMMLVPFGGLDDIRLQAGETIIIAPATGKFGGAAVHVALAMGAHVIAMGRNAAALSRLEQLSSRVSTLPITNDVATDIAALKKMGQIDTFFDISPPIAAKSTHVRSCISSVRHGGRISLMGGIRDDVAFNYADFMHRNLSLKGTCMYSRKQVSKLVKMVNTGVLPLGEKKGLKVIGKFGLDQWQEAFDIAAKCPGPDETVAFTP